MFCFYERTKLLGKAVSKYSLLIPPGSHKTGPWAWNTSLPRENVSTAYAGIVCEYLSISDSMCTFFCLKMCIIWCLCVCVCVCNMAPGKPHFGNGMSPSKRVRSCCTTRWLFTGHLPCIGFWEGPAGHGKPTFITQTDTALSLLYMSETLFQPVVDCIVSSLAIKLIARFRGRSPQVSAPDNRKQMPLAGIQTLPK